MADAKAAHAASTVARANVFLFIEISRKLMPGKYNVISADRASRDANGQGCQMDVGYLRERILPQFTTTRV